MKKHIGLFATTLLLATSLSSANANVDMCMSASNLSIFSAESMRNIDQLNQVVEANKVRVDLAEAKITYGMLGIGAGSAKIYINVKEGKLVDLNIDARVGMLGINQDIKQKITIDQMLRGRPLEFYMDGADQPTLRISPNPDFSEMGGSATLEIWDGDEFKKETITIGHTTGDKYKLYHGRATATNEVIGVSINMGGMSIPSMHVRGYKITTR